MRASVLPWFVVAAAGCGGTTGEGGESESEGEGEGEGEGGALDDPCEAFSRRGSCVFVAGDCTDFGFAASSHFEQAKNGCDETGGQLGGEPCAERIERCGGCAIESEGSCQVTWYPPGQRCETGMTTCPAGLWVEP